MEKVSEIIVGPDGHLVLVRPDGTQFAIVSTNHGATFNPMAQGEGIALQSAHPATVEPEAHGGLSAGTVGILCFVVGAVLGFIASNRMWRKQVAIPPPKI